MRHAPRTTICVHRRDPLPTSTDPVYDDEQIHDSSDDWQDEERDRD
ncbi:hypothetical protein [Mycobacteroides chelonae]|nr:hypothetical protein [Mycobacteroides chelonae]MBF9519541.1 hypothetical protein [Mycobacteroides chelonae]